ncbi:MAG: hypothetical protein ABI847_07550 [Anaerolineales bacterium]
MPPNSTAAFQTRVAHLGNPNSAEPFKFWRAVPWTDANLQRLKDIGFNTIQVNVAWGPRPADEPLNLEDVVELPPALAARYPQVVPLNCDPSPAARLRRRAEVRDRSAACHRLGLRTLFHFGAPYNNHMAYGDGPPNCISDPAVLQRYILLLEIFARDFPHVDDILVYTYDQDAWLCSEFGPCPRCLGTPLHQRLPKFLEGLAAAWRALRPGPHGRLWWEPWELSAGQVYACIPHLPPDLFGLALHSNVAEVMATYPADRWLKNTAALAADQGLPVIVEHWLSGPCEEQEPLLHLSHPLVTLRALRAIAACAGVTGIKEYYGLDPDREDPNLRATALFLANANITDEQALAALAAPYGAPAAEHMERFWQLTSRGMELFPWDVAWYVRQIGRSRVDHALSAARIRGMPCRTPSWCSTRATIFLRSYETYTEDDPWLREDIQLRAHLAAEAWAAALALGAQTLSAVPAALRLSFQRNLLDLGRLHRRETNLAQMLRDYPAAPGSSIAAPARLIAELRACLQADLANYAAEQQADASAAALGLFPLSRLEPGLPWTEAQDALRLLDADLPAFLAQYLTPAPVTQVGPNPQPGYNPLLTEKLAAKGLFSVTSR